MLYLPLAALTLAATAMIATGCGSSKMGSTTAASTSPATASTATTTPPVNTTTVTVATGKPLTHAQLIARGDAICEKTNERLAAISATTTAAFVRALPQIALYNASEAEGLGKLVPPSSMADDWSQIVNDIHFYSEYATQIAEYSNNGRQKAAGKLLEKAIALQEQWATIAKKSGFQYCSLLR